MRFWNSWSEDEVKLVQRLCSYASLLKERKALETLYNDSFPPVTSQIREVSIQGKGENSAEKRFIAVVDSRLKLRDDINEIDNRIEDVRHLLDPLEPDEKAVFIYRFFQGKSISQIAQIMDYSEPSVYRLKRRGMIKMIGHDKLGVLK